ncbi:DNA repair protein xrcc4 [Parasteatoda tepidariorum]|uniref:DNA repair protein xrcc4 n=1 Tax=Parasteatoda tepidariorum TaxID=114398 RepID=UPI00077FCA33|nr:DNA repair protein xrcc4 [Parasteatoda tepidariorum]
MFSHKALNKICLEGEEVFLLSEYEPKRNLELKILDIQHNKSYTGQASDLVLRTQAASIGLSFSDFMEQSKQALFQEPSNECTFNYSLQKDSVNYKFKWASVDQEETTIILGCIEMMEQEYVSVFDNVLISLAKEILNLNSKVKSLTAELVECKSQTDKAIHQLSEAVDIKENLEKELFSKFVLVLNEKKKKIKDIKSGKLPGSSKTSTNKKLNSKKPRIPSVSESSEENANEFLNLNEPGPSTAMNRSSLPFLDDEEDSVVPVKPSKKRSRNTVNKTKSFPDAIMPANVESTLSQVMDDDSDDLLGNL